MTSASTWAGPNRGKLVDVADDQGCGAVRHRLHERLHQHDIDDWRSRRQRTGHSRAGRRRRCSKPPPLGSDLEQLGGRAWASKPVASVSALGGAARSGRTAEGLARFADEDAQKWHSTTVVVPTPGPTGHDQDTSDVKREPDRGDLALGEGKARHAPSDPTAGPDAGSIEGQGSVPFASRVSSLGHGALRAMQACQTRTAFRQPGRRPPCPAAARDRVQCG